MIRVTHLNDRNHFNLYIIWPLTLIDNKGVSQLILNLKET